MPTAAAWIFFLSGISNAAYTLNDCYQAALKRSETVAIQIQTVEQAEERFLQAVGGVLPNITGNATYQRLDSNGSQGSSAFTKPDRPEIKLTATQPIFHGFREFAGIRQQKLTREAEKEAEAQARVQLYKDVAQAFYNVLAQEKDIVEVTTEIELSRKRVVELNQRKRIGRSRLSEVLTVESAMANLEAQKAALIGQLAAYRELFAFLTGFEPKALLNEDDRVPAKIDELDTFQSRVDDRFDVRSLKNRFEASDEAVGVAKGAHLPSIDATGNYYFKRTGILDGQKWDATATLSLPIFAGGVIQSQVRQAVSVRTQSELALSQARRQGLEEIRTIYESVVTDLQQVEALDRAAALAERNYSEQSREYRLGLVTNLDVLQALTSFEDTRRALFRARYTTRLDVERLEAAVGRKPENAAVREVP